MLLPKLQVPVADQRRAEDVWRTGNRRLPRNVPSLKKMIVSVPRESVMAQVPTIWRLMLASRALSSSADEGGGTRKGRRMIGCRKLESE